MALAAYVAEDVLVVYQWDERPLVLPRFYAPDTAFYKPMLFAMRDKK